MEGSFDIVSSKTTKNNVERITFKCLIKNMLLEL
jgi:hypothetical protein